MSEQVTVRTRTQVADLKAFTLVASGLAILALLISASPAKAIEDKEKVTHLYNQAHSLTGGCGTTEADKVADPSCPGPLPPEGPLAEPTGVAVDSYGDQYVINNNESQGEFTSHIDIFDPDGHYIGGFNVNENFVGGFDHVLSSEAVAVDSTGHLYVNTGVTLGCCAFTSVVRYDPTTYSPEAGEIAYASAPVLVSEHGSSGIAVNPVNDHLYMNKREYIVEFGPPTDGVPNEVLTEDIGKGIFGFGGGVGPVAIDAARNKIYVANDAGGGGQQLETKVYVLRASPPYELLGEFNGSTTPAGDFGGSASNLALAVDEEEDVGKGKEGNFFVGYNNRVYELKPDGTYVATIRKPSQENLRIEIAYDNSEQSPNKGYLYIPTGLAQGHLYAYEPILTEPPLVEAISFGGVSEDEAVLHATVNPAGEPTHYVFEYTTQHDFDENSFANAQRAGEGDLGSSGEGVAVSAAVAGLDPGTAYRFRVRAENQCQPGGCAVESQESFTTFAPYAQGGVCGNQALRFGNSASLPDCRAYELVTPANTGGQAPFAPSGSRMHFSSWTGSPDGSSVVFFGNGGAFPGFDTSGGYNGDVYVSRRGPDGWESDAVGLRGAEAPNQAPGGLSPDHGFGTVFPLIPESSIGAPGIAEEADYIRYPDGSLHMVGEGSVGEAKQADTRYISAGGEHIVFTAGVKTTQEEAVQLEPNAPTAGVGAIYDRTPDGALHVVSLLPEDITPSKSADYEGISADGSTVAFKLGGGGPMYLRLDNSQTVEGAPTGATFAGLSEEGRYLFYLRAGDLYRYDSQGETSVALSEGAGVTPAYVSADGSTAYFTSKAVLTSEENPNGVTPVSGKDNLYLAREDGVRFVATVTEADVKGTSVPFLGGFALGFSEWLKGINAFGKLPLRASSDGHTLLFESRANLTDFESGGKRQVYRYDVYEGTLVCISCAPTGQAPDSDAGLLSPWETLEGFHAPISGWSIVPNLSSDGGRAFFESDERLVPADEDGFKDVYEWEAEGKGSCAEPGGCIFLISSGQSARDDYLYGASESGDDVFIYTADLLNGEDTEEAPSVYDAKVGGGFPPRQETAGECLGEACQPAAVAPDDPTPASSSFEGSGNVKPEGEAKARCPKGKKAAPRGGGKSRCVPRHNKKKQHQRAKTNRRAGR